ncbi:MAG: M28 family peptidase, partial [Candidatus Eisenbacteria bacterium]|nr:M28 family peptidase [Candidatus Eisenbacteria bacterium]
MTKRPMSATTATTVVSLLVSSWLLGAGSSGAADVNPGDRRAVAPPEAREAMQGSREARAPEPRTLVPTLEAMADAVSSDSLMAMLATLTSYPTRYVITPSYAAAAAAMRDRFEALGLDEAYLHDFSCCGGTYQNVVGIKLGTVHPDEIVILGGHLDSISPDPANNAPGAEDNGSGSCGVLELARVLAPVPTDRTIHFVLFGGEEEGLYGSRAYAAMAQSEGWNVPAVITSDMIGYDDPAGAQLWVIGFVTGENSQWLVNDVKQHAETYAGLSVYVYPNNGFGSDHVPFHDRGFPSMLSIENEWDSYPCYHRTCDTIEWVSPSLLRDITIANGTTALDLAGPMFVPALVSGHVDLYGKDDDSGAVLSIPGTSYDPDVTDTQGAYALENLLPGTYPVLAEADGYLSQMLEVTVTSGQQATVDLTLIPAATGVEAGSSTPRLTLRSLAPNPFRESATVTFSLTHAGPVSGRIYDAEGRLRRALLVDVPRPAGEQTLRWDGRDDA